MKYYEKILASMCLAVAVMVAMLLPFQTAHAAASDEIHVSGYVRENGQPVAGAVVFVACSSQGKYADSPTNADGYYAVTLGIVTSCRPDYPVTATAYADNFKKVGSSTAHIRGPNLRIDIALQGTIAVPEFGWIGSGVAGGIGLGTILFARLRFTRQRGLL